jgi:leucyl-tRNA synthetase
MDGEPDALFAKEVAQKLILLLSPFAPHFAEEMWQALGGGYSVFDQPFPTADPAALKKSTVNMALQINGKVKASFDMDTKASREEVEKYVLENFQKYLSGAAPKKVIVVPGRLVNIVL